MGVGVGAGVIAPVPPAERDVKLAAAAPEPPDTLAPQQQRDRRAARHGKRSAAAHRSRGYLRPMRPMRYAFRPFRKPRGLGGLFFGLF